MNKKKILRNLVAVLCIVSMLFAYIVEIIPGMEAQAADGSQTDIENSQPEEPNFPEITFSDVTDNATAKPVADGTYGQRSTGFEIQGNVGDGFANKTFVGTVNFTPEHTSTIRFAGTNYWGSVMLSTAKGGQLLFADPFETFSIPIDATALKPENVPIGQNVEIKLSFEVTNLDDDDLDDDVRFWLHFGDELYKDGPIHGAIDYKEKLGKRFAIHTNTSESSVTIASKTALPAPEAPNLPEITFNSFSSTAASGTISDGTYGFNNGEFATTGFLADGFANKTFVGTVNFTEEDMTVIGFAGPDPWGRVQFLMSASGQLIFQERDQIFDTVQIDATALKAENVPIGQNVEIRLSIEVTNLDDDGLDDDVRFWMYFGDELYKGRPIQEAIDYAQYLGQYLGIYSSQEGSSVTIASKVATDTVDSQWDGYKIVTPATFGVADIVSDSVEGKPTATNGTADGTTVATDAANVGTYNIDKTVFQADVRHVTNTYGTFTSRFGYLYSTEQTLQLEFRVNTSSADLKIKNLRETGDTNLYVGGRFVDSVYQQGDYATVAWGKELTIDNKTTVGNSFHILGYTLWISTEFVEFDGDGNKDDLQIGFWINGELYNDTYCYYVDYNETVCSSYLSVFNMDTMISPNVEPDDLGLASGEYSASENMVIGSSAVAANKVMNGTTLESDIMFQGVGASLLYGCNGEDPSKAFKLTSATNGIQVSHTYNETEANIAFLTAEMFDTELVNNQFHLKLTTDVVDGETDDVSLSIEINNQKCTFVVADMATQLTGRIGVKCEGDATIIVGTYASDTVEEVYQCLEEGAYIAEGATRLLVDGTVMANPSESLNKPGIYNLVLTQNRLIHRQKVVLYNRYDVNEDQDVNVKDLVRMLKVADEQTHDSVIAELGEAGKLAIAYEGADKWTDDNAACVADFMRENLVGMQAEAKQTGVVTTIDTAEFEQFANKHGAFTGDFTFTLDLENIGRVDDNFNDQTDEIWILSTNAKYISVDGSYPTIQFRLINENGSQLYTSHTYKVGEKNAYVERQWRVPMTFEDYTILEVNFVVPDGVALYIQTLADLDNEVGDISQEDETVYAEDDGIKYLAHVGFSEYAPANTLMSFETAGKMGFKSLITIPKFTKDGVGVCLHDDELYTTLKNADGTTITDKTLKVQDLTYDELKKYVAGLNKGEAFSSSVPTLEQYFDICMKYKMEPVFSIHPALSEDEWGIVKTLLRQEKYKDENDDYWLYERLQIKVGSMEMCQPAIDVLGFDIGGYILILPYTSGWVNYQDVFLKVKAQALGYSGDIFDKVSVEFVDYSSTSGETLEDKIRLAKACGFTRISLYSGGAGEEFGFSSERQRYFSALGVNSFTVDFHCSMGLNW